MTYTELKERYISHPAISYWLKDRIKEIEQRDIVDFIVDLNILMKVAQARKEEVMQP